MKLRDLPLGNDRPSCAQLCAEDDRFDAYLVYHHAGRCELLEDSSRTYQPNTTYMRNGRHRLVPQLHLRHGGDIADPGRAGQKA